MKLITAHRNQEMTLHWTETKVASNYSPNQIAWLVCKWSLAVDSKEQACVTLDVVTSDPNSSSSRAPIAEAEPQNEQEEEKKQVVDYVLTWNVVGAESQAYLHIGHHCPLRLKSHTWYQRNISSYIKSDFRQRI